MNEHETPARLLEQAGAALRLARGSHARSEHVSLIRADLLQARECITLALNDLEQQWETRGQVAQRFKTPGQTGGR